MPFDTLIMKAVTDELKVALTGAAIQRISEPARGEIIIHLYSRGRQPGLLVSVDPRYARLHLTGRRPGGREQPSPFCMMLRKYLVGGRAVYFENPPLERILEIFIQPPSGLSPVKLIAEIMGRRSNLILVDEEGVILGAAKTVSLEKNPRRAIVPGERYRPVPGQDKLNPLDMEREAFTGKLLSALEEGSSSEKALLDCVEGISPLTARELLYRSGSFDADPKGAAGRLFEAVKALFEASETGRLQPVLVPALKIYAAMPLKHLEGFEQIKYDRPGELLDHFYRALIEEDHDKQLRLELINTMEKRLAALSRKHNEQEKELSAAANAPQHRLYGELLLTYGDRVARGAQTAVLPDLYEAENLVTVPLDPALSASANAQRHFNRYRKAKKGQEKIRKQLHKTGREIEYCRGLLYAIEESSGPALEEIREEMIAAGYRRDKRKEGRKTEPAPRPLKFTTSAGHAVLVGRNNRQNDYITFKLSARRDTWFHVRKLPGSHVLLKEAPFPPPESDIREASFLAAYFSRGRDSGAVAVDYTEIRHVRRRPGGRPGFVFYENFKTLTVNPGDQELRRRFELDK